MRKVFLMCSVVQIRSIDDFFEVRLANFSLIKGTRFWLGITCYFLATRGQKLPGAAGI